MKKKYLIIIITAVVLVALIGATFISLLFFRRDKFDETGIDTSYTEGKVEYYEPEGKIPYLLKRLPDGTVSDTFKVLSTTDLHLNSEVSELTLAVLRRFLDTEKPDLVILTGDLVNNIDDDEYFAAIGGFFEARRQYWAFTLGNHDGAKPEGETDNGTGRREFFDKFSSYGYNITKQSEDGVWGNGNCVINVKNSRGEISRSIFLLDSGNGTTESDCAADGIPFIEGYDYVKGSQVAWYERKLTQIAAENNGVLPKSVIYLHIPIYEYRLAYEAAKKDKSLTVYGSKIENIGSAEFSGGLFDAVMRNGSTDALFAGHDHVNDFNIEYMGVNLVYSQSLSYDGYCSRKEYPFLRIAYALDKKACYFSDGVTLLMIHGDGSTDIVPRLTHYTDGIFDGFEELADKNGIKIT